MIKVLFISNSLGFGGAAKILSFVANNLDNSKFKIIIYNLNTSPTVQSINDDIKLISDKSSNKRIIRRILQLKNIIRIIKKNNIDIIISFLNMPNFLSVLAGKLTNVPVIISERGDPYQCISLVSRIFHFVYTFADGAVFQIQGAKEFFPKKLQKKSCIIANPVIKKDESIVINRDAINNEISFVARFENKQKRQDIMLKAFKIVNEKYPDMVIKFYGIGPDEDYIKKMAEDMGLKEKVLFMGLSNNIIKDISNSQVFVLTSDYEGIPNALIEAMSIGLPVVSTDCSPGGARMLIKNGVNGLLVPTGDYKAVSEAIIKFIENPDFAKKCGENAKQIRTEFLPKKIIKKWEDYIINVYGGKYETNNSQCK